MQITSEPLSVDQPYLKMKLPIAGLVNSAWSDCKYISGQNYVCPMCFLNYCCAFIYANPG